MDLYHAIQSINSEKLSPGPWDYETMTPRTSNWAVRYKKSAVNIQALNNKNPLNYVVPITVNFYFK